MTNMTLTPDPTTASVVIQLDSLGSAAPPAITRTDVNGTAPVRMREDETAPGGFLTVRDHEPALTGPVHYQVVAWYSGEVTLGETALDLTGPARIHRVQYPAAAVSPDNVTGYAAGREAAGVVHWPVGRQDPVVIDAPPRTRSGTLTVPAASHAAAVTLADVIRPGAALMLRQCDHPGLDMYFRVQGSRVAPADLLIGGWSWTLEADYVETRVPTLPLLGAAGWSFADVAATYASFSAVRADFADFAALTLGPDFTP